MTSLLDFLVGALETFGFDTRDVSSVIVPISDPRVPGGELKVNAMDFATYAAQVDVRNARRDILIEISSPSGGYDEDGMPLGRSRGFVVGWLGDAWVIVRGEGASPYPFSAADLTA